MARRRRPGEFELIERYFRPLAGDPGAFALADDAAMLRPKAGEDLVVTTDFLGAGIHFFADDPPESIARKALRVNLSDLAAKGAEPVGYLLALALASDWDEAWVRHFTSALRADQKSYGISLLGGDTSRAPGGMSVTITAIGRLPKGTMVHREGARAGDLLFVSGTIGDAALGLRIRLGQVSPKPAAAMARPLLDRYLHPQPRIALAAAIRAHATAAMDVSDGLVGDFAHMCKASGLAGEIDAANVPLSKSAAALVTEEPALLATALTGGDDYEILAAIPPREAAEFAAKAKAARVPVARIGRLVRGRGGPVVIGRTGRPMNLGRASFDHFGR
ncbi:MAG: thiamine-phosphate kinase [Rhizobiales bacterium]|nr:thiamine-phosphate kinase [Hyphomicrobiales bacterium]